MLDVDEIRNRLKSRKIPVVAAGAGCSEQTLRDFIAEKRVPTYGTIALLSGWLERNP